MEHKAGAMLSEQSLSIFSGILSGPHALLGFMLLKSLATPFVDTDISGISHVVFVGRVGNSSVFSSVKTLLYCSLRSSAFPFPSVTSPLLELRVDIPT